MLDDLRGRPERGVVDVAEHALRVVCVGRIDRPFVLEFKHDQPVPSNGSESRRRATV